LTQESISSRLKSQKVTWTKTTRRNFISGISFVSVWIIGFLVFTVYPMGSSLYYSFTEYHVKKPPVFIGLQNYVYLLEKDPYFWLSLKNTFYMVLIAVPLTLLFSFICALLLNFKIKGQSLYRVIYFLPSIVPTVSSTLLFMWILNPNSGMINQILELVGMHSPDWFHDPFWSKPALMIMGFWGMGQTIVIYLSGLQDVPVSLIEAADLDGANWFQRLWHITIPIVSPLTLFNLITGVIAMFQYFTQAYLFASASGSVMNSSSLGAPLGSTLFYSVYLYFLGFNQFNMGAASAMAWILFLIILVCTLILLRVSKRWTYYLG